MKLIAEKEVLDQQKSKSDMITEEQRKHLLSECEKRNDIGEVTDGYHSFNELYEYRMLYNAALFNELAMREGNPFKVVKSTRHYDGELCFGGSWFIVMAELPTGQISNHYEIKDWNRFKIPAVDKAPEWDGHTPTDVADRLFNFISLEYDD